MTAAPPASISVVEFDLVGCVGWDDGTVTLAADAESSAGEKIAVCDGASFGSGGVDGTLLRGTIRGGTLLAIRLLGVTSLCGTSLGRTMLVGTLAGGAGSSGIGFGGAKVGVILLGGTGLGATGLVSAGEAFGALGRGT